MINSRNQLKTLYNISENNKNIIDDNLKYKKITSSQVTFNKKIQSIILLDNVLYSVPIEIVYDFPLLTEQFLSFIKIILVVESEDEGIFTLDNVLYSPYFHYIWRQNINGYSLQLYYSGSISQLTGSTYTIRPLYLNLSLKVYNERIWNVIQNSKT